MQQLWQTILDADWAWRVASWVLLVSALVLLPWALFWDRPGWLSRPREQCRRCRYDMTGVPGEASVTCPECGRVARSRRALRKTRRRWGVAAFAVFLLLPWHLARHKQHIRVWGWQAAVPTLVMFLVVDPDDVCQEVFRSTATPSTPSLFTASDVIDRYAISTGLERRLFDARILPTLRESDAMFVDSSGLIRAGRWTRPRYFNDWAGLWIPPEIRDSDLDDGMYWLADVVMESIDSFDWTSHGGDENTWYRLRHFAIIQAPHETQDAITRLVQHLEKKPDWPTDAADAYPVEHRVLLMFPVDDLNETPWVQAWLDLKTRQHSFAGERQDEWIAYPEIMNTIKDEIMTEHYIRLDDYRDELWMDGTDSWIQNRILVLCPPEQAGPIIESMNRIRANGTARVNERLGSD